ncbi:Gfo/Idh/MocA family oxidoreductase [Aquirufa sp. KTFRIE-69F]|uniref:Gfo/Idh/MocA family oxidoreductase n=1 Tax=Aquirufa originis TaxID=3096514 RepID=A0ABW6D5W9_9BACT
MNKLVRIGVISTASIAERLVIPAINAMKSNFVLAGIASRSNSKAEIFADKFRTKGYNSYDDLLSEDEIEAVYIPLPNSLHLEYVEKALNNNKNVLVEKSLGCSYEEVEFLTSIARSRGLVIVENFQFRFHPQINVIKEILLSGKIGEMRSLRASFGFPPFSDINNIRYNELLGGGALLDAGAYTTKISQILLGTNLKVKASNLNFQTNYSVDIWGGAYLQDEKSGIFSELAFGFDNFYQCGIEIWGSKGRLTTNRLFTAPSEFIPEIMVETSSGNEIIKAPSGNHFENMLLHFYNLIKTKDNLEIEHIQNLDQARLLNEIKDNAYVK